MLLDDSPDRLETTGCALVHHLSQEAFGFLELLLGLRQDSIQFRFLAPDLLALVIEAFFFCLGLFNLLGNLLLLVAAIAEAVTHRGDVFFQLCDRLLELHRVFRDFQCDSLARCKLDIDVANLSSQIGVSLLFAPVTRIAALLGV